MLLQSKVNVDVLEGPLTASRGSQAREDIQAGLDSGATRVSEVLRVFVSPLGVLS